MNISVKELKEKESSKVEEISWNISNRMRELGNTSVYGGFCLSYVAYLSLKNKINDVYQLVEYVELTFSPERVGFIKGNIENLWNVAIEIGEAYSEETLLAVVLWWPLQGNKSLNEKRIHPTQKPVALYDWIFKNYAEPGQKILDTHLGSGSSRIAAYEAGLGFIGFEIDPFYFQLEEERFSEYTSQTSLFHMEEKKK